MSDEIKGHRRQRSVGGTYQPVRQGKLFEHFVVVGIPPLTESGNPEILFKYPTNVALPFEITHFCFPDGVRKRAIRRAGSFSDLNRVVFGALSVLESSKNSFVFLVTCGEDVYFVSCVITDEILEACPSFIHIKDSCPVKSGTMASYIGPRAYCFVSRFPFFKLHFSVLYSLLARERLYVLESKATVANFMEIPSMHTTEKNEIIAMLGSYAALLVPESGKSLHFTLPGQLYPIDFKIPEGDLDGQVADWCLTSALSVLSVEQFLSLFAAVILEKPTVIVCQNIGVLTSIVLSIIPLIRPLSWQGPFIPVLPSSLFEYMQAPVPFVVGVLGLPEEVKQEIPYAAVLKVDDKTDLFFSEYHGSLGKILPNYQKFLNSYKFSDLELCFKALRSCTTEYHDAYKTTDKHLEITKKIMEITKKYSYSLFDILRPHLDENFDVSNPEQAQKLIQAIPKSSQDFFSLFLSTQLASVYFAENLQDILQKRPSIMDFLNPRHNNKTKSGLGITFRNRAGSIDYLHETYVQAAARRKKENMLSSLGVQLTLSDETNEDLKNSAEKV